MRRILLLQNENYLDSQVIKPVNYDSIIDGWKSQMGGNSGNKLFTTSILKILTKPDIDLHYYSPSMEIEYINNTFDMIIMPTANIFGKHYINGLVEYTKFFNKITIPIYIVGAGLQCNTEEEIPQLAKEIGSYVSDFCKSIYHTGGELALRGHYTKKFLDLTVNNTAWVTGCPSLYQLGKDLRITKKNTFSKLAINGSVISMNNTDLYKLIYKYDDLIYIDQDEFIYLIYDQQLPYENINTFKLLWKYSNTGLNLFTKNKVKLFYDIPVWLDYLKHNIDFSVGTRIHGNIAALLAGVPAMVIYQDLRTKELAEFFDIPCRNALFTQEETTISSVYNHIDYSNFNNSFERKFLFFEKFFLDHHISYNLNDNSYFNSLQNQYEWLEPQINIVNIQYIQKKMKYTPYKKLFSGKSYSILKKKRMNSKVNFTNLK